MRIETLYNDIARSAHDIVMHENGPQSHTPRATANTPHITQTFDHHEPAFTAENA